MVHTGEQLKENKQAVKYYWIPEPQPPARKDHVGFFTDAFNFKFQDYIDGLFEPLRVANPNYISRSSLGKDASGTYDVWKYELTPANYEKTIIISSSLHGSEVTLAVTMARFLHYLINEYEKHPELTYIREKVRIVYVPFANPWGTSQTTRTRYNSNGVDLNRNWDYKWSSYVGAAPFGHDYKGTAPFSEVETRYMRDLILDYPDAIAHLDLHNTEPSTRDYFVYMPENYEYKTYEQLSAYFAKGIENPDILLDRNPNPSLSNYRYHVNGIPCAHPEWCDTMSGYSQYGSEEITKALEWLANVIIEHCRYYKPKSDTITNIVANSALTDNTKWTTGGIGVLSTSNGVIKGNGLSSNNTPYLHGELSNNSFVNGDLVYARVKVKCPPNCTRVELNFRDINAGITGNVSTINNPQANTFLELKGIYKLTKGSTQPIFQVRFYFATAGEVVGQIFEITEPLLINLTKDISSTSLSNEEINFILNQSGSFFTGGKEITIIENAQALDKNTKSITM